MKFPAKIDVAIVGAGPAGSTAARVLARSGIATAIFEQAPLPRYKTCGGGILWRAAKLLQDCPWQHVVEHQAFAVELNLLDSHRRFVAQRAFPLVSMTMRSTFDHALILEAQRAGTQVFDSCRVNGLQDRGQCVELSTSQGTLHAQFVIGADGVRSIVARSGGWRELPRLIPALEWEVRLPPDVFARFAQTARFDFDLPAHGYAWVFPKRDHLSIGVLTTRRDAGNLQTDCQAYMQRLGIRPVLDIARHGYVIPVRPRAEGFSRGRLLLAGDAAGLADPVTAEGITHSLRSGQLAAEAIVSGTGQPDKVRRLYTTALHREILPELRHATVLAELLYTYPRLRSTLLGRYGQRLTDVMADIMMGSRTYRQVLHEPLNYLQLLRKR